MIYQLGKANQYFELGPATEHHDLGHENCGVCEAARQMGGMNQTITRLQAMEKEQNVTGP